MVSARRLLAGSLVAVVGESHYQAGILAADRDALASAPVEHLVDFALEVATDEPDLRWFETWLCPEPDNPYDANAIAVWSLGAGELGDRLGYLSRDSAVEYGPVFTMLRGWGFNGAVVPGFIRFGGPDGRTGGVVLALSHADYCLRAMEHEREAHERELARLNRELDRLAELEPNEREVVRERLSYEASAFGRPCDEVAHELGYADEAEAQAAAMAHASRTDVEYGTQ
jgi:hypothetical protein